MPTSQPLVWSSPASHSLGMVYDLDMLDAILGEKKKPWTNLQMAAYSHLI